MRILPIKTSFHGTENVMRDGLNRFASLHKADQEWLLYQEELRQMFNEIHPELKTESSKNPLDMYVEDFVSFLRNIRKEAKSSFRTRKITGQCRKLV